MFLVWVVGVVFLVSWALIWCVRGAQEAMLARLPVGTEVPREERGVIQVAFALGISEYRVLELHRTGQMPPPCTERPLRWERGVIDPWIGERLLRSFLERSGPGKRMLECLESLGQEDVLAILGAGLPANEALLRPPVVTLPTKDTGFVDDSGRKMLGSSRMSVPVEGNASMAQFPPPPPGGSFPWDDWTQRTTPFLWTLADIAHALKIPLPVTEKMHAQGHLPPEMWPDPPLWEGHVIQPWVRDTLRDAHKLGHALVASQQQEEKNLGPVEGHEVEDTLVAFGLLSLRGLAHRVEKDLTTLRQWYHEGCPACPMPYPDVRAIGLETGREEPYWFTDGQIRKWLAQVNSKKPVASDSKLDRTQPTNTPYEQKEKRGVMGKIYDRLRQDFDTTLTVMSTGEASLKDLAEDFPRILGIAARLDAPIEKIVPLANKLALAGLWSPLTVDADTLRSPTAAGVFARGTHGVCLARTGAIEHAAADIADALRSPLLLPDSQARDFLRFQQAFVNMEASLYNVAAAAFDTIAAEGGLCADQARYWRANLAATSESRFKDALEAVKTIGNRDLSGIFKHLLRGDIHRLNARFADAETEYTQARNLAQQAKADGLEGRAIMHLAETIAWTRPQEGHRLALDAIEKAQKQNNKIDEFRAWLALAVAGTGIHSEETLQEHLRKVVELTQLIGGDICKVRIGTVEAFQAAVTGNTDALQQAQQMITSTTGMLGTSEFQNDVLGVWSEASSVEQSRHARETQWLDGPDEAMRRWREVVTVRQNAA